MARGRLQNVRHERDKRANGDNNRKTTKVERENNIHSRVRQPGCTSRGDSEKNLCLRCCQHTHIKKKKQGVCTNTYNSLVSVLVVVAGARG